MKIVKRIFWMVLLVFFLTGFFFMDQTESIKYQDEHDIPELSPNQKQEIMTYMEVAKFKLYKLEKEENEESSLKTREDYEEYLSRYFSDPFLSEFVNHKILEQTEGDEEYDQFINRYVSLSSDLNRPIYTLLEQDTEAMVSWYDRDNKLRVNVIVIREASQWKISSIEFKEEYQDGQN
ncbi:hypothetical protein [Bacillus suaedae]|uniref:DUF3993 domain-containing protein n=1 Tax=Halalkalibacter suaedae TaxID=2822140 RepID=A0A940WY36_9BACI|nr:hypothetical protein [Bacillus suaedae]MBP3950064.1 hypothetical protein [Bacillus suaedae]